MQGCVRRCTNYTHPNWIPGCISKKYFVPSIQLLSLFNKGLWNKNKRKQKQQRTDSPFSIKGAAHLMILMHINNHAKHITVELVKQICHRLSRFPLFSWPCDPWCYTNWIRLQLLRELSRSVCQILPGAPLHDLWALDELGICSIGSVPCRCALAVPYSNLRIGTKEENHGTHILLFPQFFSPRFPVFFQMFKVSHVFHHLFPSFSPFLSSMFSHVLKFAISGEAKPWWNFPQLRDGFTAAFQATRQDLVNAAWSERIRKDPKGPKSVMWHSLNHWTWLVT